MCDYPFAQWFEPHDVCRERGKPAGRLHGFGDNRLLGYFCKKHAEKHIKDAHRKGKFAPDAAFKEA